MDDETTGGEQAVVVVEDERELAELYAEALRDQYAVETATDGEEALSVIDETTDVVILDRRLPRLHGDKVLEELREQGIDSRVVMVTAVDPDLDIAGLPFESYLTKPVGTEELLETIAEQANGRTYEQQVRRYQQVRAQIEVLREEEPEWVLEGDERFEELCATADELRADIEELFEGHDRLVEPLTE